MARKYGPKASEKIGQTLHEWKRGKLKSSSGHKVKSQQQAIAIGISQARRAGYKVPPDPTRPGRASHATKSGEWIVMEFHGKGDPMFGGGAEDRVLGKDGFFLTGSHSRDDYGTFASEAAAMRAAEKAPNRRAKGLLLALPK